MEAAQATGPPLFSEQVTFAVASYATSYVYSGLSVEITGPRVIKTTKSLSAFSETGEVRVGAIYTAAQYSPFWTVTSRTDANGRQISYTTDALGRLHHEALQPRGSRAVALRACTRRAETGRLRSVQRRPRRAGCRGCSASSWCRATVV